MNFEIPFLLITASILFFPKIDRWYLKYIVPLIPLWVFYFSFEFFYKMQNRSIRPSDIKNVFLIPEYSLVLSFFFLLLLSILIFSITFLFIKNNKKSSRTTLMAAFLTRFGILTVLLMFLVSSKSHFFYERIYNYTGWSQEKSIKENGRFFSFFFYGYQESKNLKILQDNKKVYMDIKNKVFPGSIQHPRNIYIFVLESFIDPRELTGVQYYPSPLSQELSPFLMNGNAFSHVISPVYGGNTAQAEFEVLTGIKALAKIDSTEFNVMQGGQLNGFIKRLEDYSYKSNAIIATSSKYYNAQAAYKSLGFDSVEFLGEAGVNTSQGLTFDISDSVLLEYTLSKIKALLKESNQQPILNYVLGIYGHLPYKRNLQKEPDIVKASNNDYRVGRIANQFYYRTKAVAKLINELIKLDSNSIIYITSDHIPPILDENIKYNLDNRVNISLFIKDGETMNVSGKHYFEIPWMIWSELSLSHNKDIFSDEYMEKLYYQALSETISHDGL